MKSIPSVCRISLSTVALAATLSFTGCETTDNPTTTGSGAAGPFATQAKLTDGRTVEIGPSSAADGGYNFKEPHLNKCWIVAGFDFNGYDTLYIAPTESTAKFKDDEAPIHAIAKENYVIELKRTLGERRVFANIVTRESDIKPGAKVLKLQNTITEFSKGGGAARYFAGLYGAGQPNLRVAGVMTDGDRKVFTYEGRRSGVTANARLSGGFMKDEDVQIGDIRSLTLDLSDFITVIAKKYPGAK